MSTFPGLLSEIENISVDRFDGENLNSTAYFLSHCHYDHMKGLQGYRFKRRLGECPNIFIYCSTVSKLWVSNFLPGLDHKIKELPINTSVVIDVPSSAPGRVQSISVTALPAGHCPGSVMFLFCSDEVNVLYTGDIRMEANEVKKMKQLKGLLLDKVYLDTTFYSPKYAHFPSRDQSMNRLVEFCKEWLDQHEKNVIDIRRSVPKKHSLFGANATTFELLRSPYVGIPQTLKNPGIGIEYSYMTLYDKLGMSVHVCHDEWQRYARIPELAPAVTFDENKTRIHACVRSGRSEHAPTFKSMHEQIQVEHIRSIKLCALHATNLRPTDEILNYHTKDNIFKLVYSSHCSHNELREILDVLSPAKVTPCVVPEDQTEDEVVACLLPDLCTTTPVTSSFESSVDFSPFEKTLCDDQPVKNCSQSSTNSFSSNDDTPTKSKAPLLISAQRYAVTDSSDDEISSTPPKSNNSNGFRTVSKDDSEDPPWAQYLQASKKLRTE